MNKIIELVPFSREYLEKSYEWCNDPIIQKLIMTNPVTKEQQEEWYNSLSSRNDYKIWGISYNGVPIGACGVKGIKNHHGTYWGYIGDKEYWGGHGRQLVMLVENKAKELSLNRLNLYVLHTNLRAKHLYEKLLYVEYKRDETFIYYYKDLN